MQCVVLENLCLDFDTVVYGKATRVCEVATCVCKGETHQQAMALSLALHSGCAGALSFLRCTSGCAFQVGITLCEGKVAASVGTGK